ncbi:hypothetical protein K466DRAFT_236082 [Polyporus arcularius HHB13444]|uniref:Uncharacterized protein n=1 Tax=Polyporus arcularius HHB13444 TaxID=1314778 RepID=A0A5C3P388_9APHY|nr:hypothetical protein K466DRAFT_236082 [Polyporus arcularius HHB13444]
MLVPLTRTEEFNKSLEIQQNLLALYDTSPSKSLQIAFVLSCEPPAHLVDLRSQNVRSSGLLENRHLNQTTKRSTKIATAGWESINS